MKKNSLLNEYQTMMQKKMMNDNGMVMRLLKF